MRQISCFFLLIILFCVATAPVRAQSLAELQIVGVDTSEFPDVAVSFIAQDASGNGFSAFESISLSEDQRTVDRYKLIEVETGVDVTFVIDANSSIAGIDLIGDVSRLEKVRSAIIEYAEQKMSRAGRDRISVLVPDQTGQAQFLLRNATSIDDVVAGMNSYNPTQFAREAPVQTMLEMAFQQASEREPTTKYQAVVFFSDAEFLREQLDYFALRDIELLSDVVFFGAVLGKFASDDEIANMAELYIPSGGYALHMPEVANLAPILNTIKSNAMNQALQFRSQVAVSGEHQIGLELDGFSAETTFTIEVLAPEIAFALDDLPIERSGGVGLPLEELSPTTQQIRAQLSWPDGHDRSVELVQFYVDELEQVIDVPPVLDTTGLLSFDWDITYQDAGSYNLSVIVVDELGLAGRTKSYMQSVTLNQAMGLTPTPTMRATATPAPSPEEQINSFLETYVTQRNSLMFMVALIGGLMIVLLVKMLRKSAEPPPEPTTPKPIPIPPPKGVFLQRIIDDHGQDRLTDLIPVKGRHITIGSDPFHAEIVLDDQSVSRFHASIKFEDGRYVLYDEGSAYGSRVNFERVGLTPRPIKANDELEFGSIKLRFRIVGSEPVATDEE